MLLRAQSSIYMQNVWEGVSDHTHFMVCRLYPPLMQPGWQRFDVVVYLWNTSEFQAPDSPFQDLEISAIHAHVAVERLDRQRCFKLLMRALAAPVVECLGASVGSCRRPCRVGALLVLFFILAPTWSRDLPDRCASACLIQALDSGRRAKLPRPRRLRKFWIAATLPRYVSAALFRIRGLGADAPSDSGLRRRTGRQPESPPRSILRRRFRSSMPRAVFCLAALAVTLYGLRVDAAGEHCSA